MIVSYISYLKIIISGSNFISIYSVNQPRLESILRSVVHYASDPVDMPSAKMAFNILSKTLTLWGGPTQSSNGTSVDPGRSLPGFEQFMYEHILRICFEVPMKTEFSVTDGQSNLVIYFFQEVLFLTKEVFNNFIFIVIRS